MRVDLKAVAVSCALMVAPFVAHAQRCVGSPSFRTSTAHLGFDLQFSDGAKGYGASVLLGSTQGLFGSFGIGATDYDGISEGSTSFAFGGGLAVPFGNSGKAEFCPVVGLAFVEGPDVGPVDASGRAASFGAMIGGVAATTQSTEIVPFGGAVYVNESFTARVRGNTNPIPGSLSGRGDGVNFVAGAGFIVSRVLTITPTLSFPLDADNTDATFGISFTYNFGVPRQVTTRR